MPAARPDLPPGPAIRRVAAVLALALAAGPALAQSPPPSPTELGRLEYEANCASCHGIGARGDGPMRPFLVRPPTDLTTLSRRHGGVFPRTLVAELIDGRGITEPGSHGTRDMPVWGRVYREQSEQQLKGTPLPREWSVRGRILALADYLQSLQQP